LVNKTENKLFEGTASEKLKNNVKIIFMNYL